MIAVTSADFIKRVLVFVAVIAASNTITVAVAHNNVTARFPRFRVKGVALYFADNCAALFDFTAPYFTDFAARSI